MKKLVQKVFDINPSLMSSPERLQKYFDRKSSEGWEYCGQIGIFHLFKRWEEIPNVVEGGSSNVYGQGYNPYRPQTYQPSYQPTYSPYNPNQGFNNNPYNPSRFGVRVDEDDNKYNGNPFDE